mgnify:CR=1 FL=1
MYSIHDEEIFERVKKLVNFYYFKFNVREPQHDVLNSVVLSLMTTKYIERYDNSRPIHNYLSGFIYNYFCKLYKREGYSVSKAQALEQPLTDEEGFTLLSTIEAEVDYDPDDSMEVEHIAKLLGRKFPYHTYLVYDCNLRIHGIFTVLDKVSFDSSYFIIPRSAEQVFRLLYMGLSQTDIKSLLLVSKSWTSKIVSRIISLKELRDFARSKGFRIKD